MSDGPAMRLVVFSDDWGRHPSSCQHLVRHLLPRHEVLWVNTIGTRSVRLSWEDAGKVGRRLRDWLMGSGRGVGESAATAGSSPTPTPRVLAPKMWPGFRRRWQRAMNRMLIDRAVRAALARAPAHPGNGEREPDTPPTVVLTTLPISADLVGRLPADRWVYYCVDDFSVWPGVDGSVMDRMERELVSKVDHVVAASAVLAERVRAMGVPEGRITRMTHGIDLEHWSRNLAEGHGGSDRSAGEGGRVERSAILAEAAGWPRPVTLFWGLIDRRLDVVWCRALAERPGTLALVGPQQEPHPELLELSRSCRLRLPGPASYDDLPALAGLADVLVMPYDDLPVTRAMQPLKLKEYLAAGWPDHLKPVVVRDLPATRDWADAADVVAGVEQLMRTIDRRMHAGVPAEQVLARKRLADESWQAKAMALEPLLRAGAPPAPLGRGSG